MAYRHGRSVVCRNSLFESECLPRRSLLARTQGRINTGWCILDPVFFCNLLPKSSVQSLVGPDIDDRPICHMPLVTSRKPLAESQPTVSSPPAAPSSRATLEAIKKQGRAKVKTARGAQDRERATAAEAEQQWKDAFDFLFDSSADPATCGDFLVGGRTVLVMIPGFNSWTSLQPSDVECWKKAALLKSPDGSPSALSLVFRWPCGAFLQSSDVCPLLPQPLSNALFPTCFHVRTHRAPAPSGRSHMHVVCHTWSVCDDCAGCARRVDRRMGRRT